MRMLSVTVLLGCALAASAATAQTPQAPPAAAPPAAQATGAPPVQAEGKRDACRRDVETKALRGQAKRDEMQLCVAQSQLDCVKQAIVARTAGAQRKDFMKSCMGAKAASRSPI